jgi:DNA-binding response OmpR family regulator
MLTSRGHRADRTVIDQTGIVRVVAKPFSSHEMVKIVGELFASPGGGTACPEAA